LPSNTIVVLFLIHNVGVGECYEAFKHVFGPVFNELNAYQQLPLVIPNNLQPRPSPSPIPTLPSSLTRYDKIKGMSAFNNQITIDTTNTFISPSCAKCTSICKHHRITIPTPEDICRPFDHPPTSTELYAAADMKAMRTLLGMQEANTFCFCPLCLATRDDIPLAKVHAPVTLNKYNQHHQSTINHTFQDRTNTSQQHHHQSFINDDHGDIKKARHHGNVIHPPLITSSIQNHLAPFPLHVRLGVTKKAVDLIQNQCSSLDKQVNLLKGMYSIINKWYIGIYVFSINMESNEYQPQMVLSPYLNSSNI
jgi:hypothetical protein